MKLLELMMILPPVCDGGLGVETTVAGVGVTVAGLR